MSAQRFSPFALIGAPPTGCAACELPGRANLSRSPQWYLARRQSRATSAPDNASSQKRRGPAETAAPSPSQSAPEFLARRVVAPGPASADAPAAAQKNL